jgi:hypothetical protein
MLFASVALPFLLFCYAAKVNYHAAFALADERIERAADIAAEHALRVFQSISVTFDSVEQITRGRSGSWTRILTPRYRRCSFQFRPPSTPRSAPI